MTNSITNESQHTMASVENPIYLSEVVFRIFSEIVCTRFAVLILCIILTGNVFGQQEDSLSATDSISSGKIFNQSINMCPGGIVFGVYSINYEYLFGQTHGLVARFDYESVAETLSDDIIDADGCGFTLNYRWHLSGAMESLYLGSYLRYKIYNGTGTSGLESFNFTLRDLTLGLNVGKRWVWNSGINVNCAFGYGFSTLSQETEPTSSSIDATLNEFINEYTFIDPFYGELSIGYAF